MTALSPPRAMPGVHQAPRLVQVPQERDTRACQGQLLEARWWVSLVVGPAGLLLVQVFWRSTDTASRRARVFAVNRSIAGDLLTGLPSSPWTSRTDSR